MERRRTAAAPLPRVDGRLTSSDISPASPPLSSKKFWKHRFCCSCRRDNSDPPVGTWLRNAKYPRLRRSNIQVKYPVSDYRGMGTTEVPIAYIFMSTEWKYPVSVSRYFTILN